jgi:hypothetical protein
MKFGQVEDPSIIDFTLPKDHPRTKEILSQNKKGTGKHLYRLCKME